MADGDCYPVAYRLVVDSADPDVRLVHGRVDGNGPTAGSRFPHAWVETVERTTIPANTGDVPHGPFDLALDVVVDRSNGNDLTVPRAVYYERGRVVEGEVARYTRLAAMVLAVRSGHYGPWGGDDQVTPRPRGPSAV